MNPSTADSKRPRLLLVDDEPVNIRVLYELFKADCELLVATSGEQAVEICHREQPDLVLLDIMMPGMDGLETCRRIRENPAAEALPIIFVTGQSSPEEESAGLRAGAMDFISKPINPSVVRARVNTQLLVVEQRRQLIELARIDGLTGIANRRHFNERLEREWLAALRQQRPLGLILIDIDHFKAYNDQCGHQAGDEALEWVASTLKQALRRPTDLVARYGGEEFACILPETGVEQALGTAAHLCAAVSKGHYRHPASPTSPHLTISLGAASLVPKNELAAELLRRADEGLYRAKAQGRNRAEPG